MILVLGQILLYSGTVVSTVASQQDGPGFKSRLFSLRLWGFSTIEKKSPVSAPDQGAGLGLELLFLQDGLNAENQFHYIFMC